MWACRRLILRKIRHGGRSKNAANTRKNWPQYAVVTNRRAWRLRRIGEEQRQLEQPKRQTLQNVGGGRSPLVKRKRPRLPNDGGVRQRKPSVWHA
jgi:hypothetical protein